MTSCLLIRVLTQEATSSVTPIFGHFRTKNNSNFELLRLMKIIVNEAYRQQAIGVVNPCTLGRLCIWDAALQTSIQMANFSF